MQAAIELGSKVGKVESKEKRDWRGIQDQRMSWSRDEIAAPATSGGAIFLVQLGKIVSKIILNLKKINWY